MKLSEGNTEKENRRHHWRQNLIISRYVSQKKTILENYRRFNLVQRRNPVLLKVLHTMAGGLSGASPSSDAGLTTVRLCFLDFSCRSLFNKLSLINIGLRLRRKCYQPDYVQNTVFQSVEIKQTYPSSVANLTTIQLHVFDMAWRALFYKL